MKNVSEPEKLESIRSLQSAISKSEKALARISQKGASTTLLAGRLHALRVGLAMLESTWHQEPHAFTLDDIAGLMRRMAGEGTGSRGTDRLTPIHREDLYPFKGRQFSEDPA